VVIAEDNYLVHRACADSWKTLGRFRSWPALVMRELLDAVRRFSPSAVLTDIRMPPSHHRTEHPGIGVVVRSQHTDESYARAPSMTAPQAWHTC
jgi:hypothetical protein